MKNVRVDFDRRRHDERRRSATLFLRERVRRASLAIGGVKTGRRSGALRRRRRIGRRFDAVLDVGGGGRRATTKRRRRSIADVMLELRSVQRTNLKGKFICDNAAGGAHVTGKVR